MKEVLVIGAGPAGLLAAWVARQRGAKVKVLATGIGTTHVSPGWIGVLNTDSDLHPALMGWIAAHPEHPYALAGVEALAGGLVALREVGQAAGINFIGSDQNLAEDARSDDFKATEVATASPILSVAANFQLPTALGAVAQAALAPESMAAGDLRQPGALLIAGPAGWRDFYPKLCAENLVRQGFPAHATTFDLPEMQSSKFDATSTGLARLFDRADVRARVAEQLRPRLNGATRAGLPAVLGLNHSAEAWRDLSDRLGVPAFEIPTLPPSVPGTRLYNAFKASLSQAGVPILLDMTAARGIIADDRVTGIVAPDVVRDRTHRADTFILATGGLYGGGITSDYTSALREVVFGLPIEPNGELGAWFDPRLLSKNGHPIHAVGVRVDAQMRPVDETGRVILENVRIAGRLLADYNPIVEGSTEGVWVATSFRAAICGLVP